MTETTPRPRVETGPLQIGDDWPGVFIRGDNALMHYSPAVNEALRLCEDNLPPDKTMALWELLRLLTSCVNGRDPEGLQKITPAPEAAT